MRFWLNVAVMTVLITTMAGCAAWRNGGEQADAREIIPAQVLIQQEPQALRMSGESPGWVSVALNEEAMQNGADVVMRAGSVLRGEKGDALLTLANVGLSGEVAGQRLLVPVVAFHAPPTTADARAMGRQAARSRYSLADTLVRVEMVELAYYVSSPDRTWKPSRPQNLVLPAHADFLNAEVLEEAGEWERATHFFAERTPIQLAAWMLLYNVNRADLDQLLVAYGPGMKRLSGETRSEAVRRVVRDAFNLWAAMGYNPATSNLAADYPDLVESLRRQPTYGETFSGSATALRPITAEEAEDPPFRRQEGLLTATAYDL